MKTKYVMVVMVTDDVQLDDTIVVELEREKFASFINGGEADALKLARSLMRKGFRIEQIEFYVQVVFSSLAAAWSYD